jgi:hypothetical protein
MTPLIWAADNNHAEVLRLLLDRGAELEARDDDGETAFFRAVAYGHEEIVGMLLSKGADVRAENMYGVTPLQAASGEGNLGMVRLFVQHLKGQGLHDVDIGGRTALWYSCCFGHTELARFLLLAGVDHTIPGGCSKAEEEVTITPREKAQQNKQDDTVTLLQVIAHDRLHVHTIHERVIQRPRSHCICPTNTVAALTLCLCVCCGSGGKGS